MAEIGTRKDVPLDVDLLRHMVVNTIRSHKIKFQREYGNIVLACDSKKYWRKQYFQYYKANRKKAREDSGLDWHLIFDSINLIKEEFIKYFPYQVIEVEGAEADDVIATLTEQANIKKDPVLIISGDHDFYQLQKYDLVKQYSPVQKKFVKGDLSPEKYVIEHIVKGDKGDGIPNILSEDDSIVSGIRQKPVSSKKLQEWLDNPDLLLTKEFKHNFQRNKTLVDFDCIPLELKENIINSFTNYPVKDKSKLLDYFIANRMKQMIEYLEDF